MGHTRRHTHTMTTITLSCARTARVGEMVGHFMPRSPAQHIPPRSRLARPELRAWSRMANPWAGSRA
jgi:hypothetical protein